MGRMNGSCEFHLERRCCPACDYHAIPHTDEWCGLPKSEPSDAGQDFQWCTRCGVLSHATADCPQGFRTGPGNFDDGASGLPPEQKCHLGDAWHATADCPQGFRTGPGNFDAGASDFRLKKCHLCGGRVA